MVVTIIGSGNVASVLGMDLLKKGHKINQVYSRHYFNALQLATELKAEAIADLSFLNEGADIYMIAVSDDALPEITEKLALKNKLVIHTAGSISKEVLNKVSTNYGVVWPMKMIRKSMTTLGPLTMVVDGSSEPVIQQLEKFAYVFSSTVTRAEDTVRIKMHMLAAITANFTNHLYHLAADYCKAENIDFRVFYPIIEETAQRIQGKNPGTLQAGPAFRGDWPTIEKHLALLANYPETKKLYKTLSESIQFSFRDVSADTKDGG